jgi:hypothetical protein
MMIKKIIIYSLVGIILGVLVMLLPIAFFLCSDINVSTTLSENAPEKNATDSNLATGGAVYKARASSLSEAAQIYGKNEAFQETFPSTILVPLMLAAVSGLFAGITVIVIAKKTPWLK